MRYIMPSCLIMGLIVISTAKLYSQECEVATEALKGKYEGDCKNGKADGKGKATGTDMYEGEFKSGLPNGKGIYTWANGNSYDGRWQKGKKEGTGVMLYKTSNGDSSVTGFWKKDEYVGKYEKPYEILSKGQAHSVNVTLVKNDPRNEILLSVSERQSNLAPVTQPVLTYVNVAEGFFTERLDNNAGNKNSYTFKQVTYPFKATFSFGVREVEIVFFAPGLYDVKIVYIN